MTEPPEPRRPEEGGGEDGPDAYRPDPGAPIGDDDPIDWDVWDDDVLLDQVGSGEERDEFDETGELRDMLESWRDDVDAEPVPPIAERAEQIHDFNQQVNRYDGGTPSMAISDDAAIIRQVAEDQTPAGAAQLAATNLGTLSFPDLDVDTAGAIQEAINGLQANADRAGNAAGGEDEAAIHGAAAVAVGALTEVGAAIQNAQQLIDQAKAAAQTAAQLSDSAIAACEQFRQTCGDIAARHGA